MIIDQVQWYQDNVVDKIKPRSKITQIGNGHVMISIDGWKYDRHEYENFSDVLDVIKQKYIEDNK